MENSSHQVYFLTLVKCRFFNTAHYSEAATLLCLKGPVCRTLHLNCNQLNTPFSSNSLSKLVGEQSLPKAQFRDSVWFVHWFAMCNMADSEEEHLLPL